MFREVRQLSILLLYWRAYARPHRVGRLRLRHGPTRSELYVEALACMVVPRWHALGPRPRQARGRAPHRRCVAGRAFWSSRFLRGVPSLRSNFWSKLSFLRARSHFRLGVATRRVPRVARSPLFIYHAGVCRTLCFTRVCRIRGGPILSHVVLASNKATQVPCNRNLCSVAAATVQRDKLATAQEAQSPNSDREASRTRGKGTRARSANSCTDHAEKKNLGTDMPMQSKKRERSRR